MNAQHACSLDICKCLHCGKEFNLEFFGHRAQSVLYATSTDSLLLNKWTESMRMVPLAIRYDGENGQSLRDPITFYNYDEMVDSVCGNTKMRLHKMFNRFMEYARRELSNPMRHTETYIYLNKFICDITKLVALM